MAVKPGDNIFKIKNGGKGWLNYQLAFLLTAREMTFKYEGKTLIAKNWCLILCI